MTDIAVQVKDVAKEFSLATGKQISIKSSIVNIFKSKSKKKKDIFQVLKGVSFDIKEGDFFGIVGRNGSGKSTLLKIIAEIYQPTSGKINVKGKLVPFIELGVGFNPELTGRENVFLNGALLGFSKKEMEAKYDAIVEFAELERFMDQKLKNYSSGMQVRLAFSVAIQADADVLLIDEVLAVGDEAFQRKCHQYFEKLKKAGKTVIFVTHSMDAVRRYCNRAVLVRDGEIIIDGTPEEVADEYSLNNLETPIQSDNSTIDGEKPYIRSKVISAPILENTDILELEVSYKNTDDRPVYPKVILYYEGTPVMCANGKLLYNIVTNDELEHKFKYTLPLSDFNQGELAIDVILLDSKNEVALAEYGQNGEQIIIVKNQKTGNKIGGIFKDLGNLEFK